MTNDLDLFCNRKECKGRRKINHMVNVKTTTPLSREWKYNYNCSTAIPYHNTTLGIQYYNNMQLLRARLKLWQSTLPSEQSSNACIKYNNYIKQFNHIKITKKWLIITINRLKSKECRELCTIMIKMKGIWMIK
jgi:hypothetical protein